MALQSKRDPYHKLGHCLQRFKTVLVFTFRKVEWVSGDQVLGLYLGQNGPTEFQCSILTGSLLHLNSPGLAHLAVITSSLYNLCRALQTAPQRHHKGRPRNGTAAAQDPLAVLALAGPSVRRRCKRPSAAGKPQASHARWFCT